MDDITVRAIPHKKCGYVTTYSSFKILTVVNVDTKFVNWLTHYIVLCQLLIYYNYTYCSDKHCSLVSDASILWLCHRHWKLTFITNLLKEITVLTFVKPKSIWYVVIEWKTEYSFVIVYYNVLLYCWSCCLSLYDTISSTNYYIFSVS